MTRKKSTQHKNSRIGEFLKKKRKAKLCIDSALEVKIQLY